MELQELLKWLLSGGAGAAAYWLMDNVKWLVDLKPEAKRYVAWLLAGGLAVVGYLATVGMGYEIVPIGVRAWIEALFAVVAVAVGLSQLIHARLRLSKNAQLRLTKK